MVRHQRPGTHAPESSLRRECIRELRRKAYAKEEEGGSSWPFLEESLMERAALSANKRSDADVVFLEPALRRLKDKLNVVGASFDRSFLKRFQIMNFQNRSLRV